MEFLFGGRSARQPFADVEHHCAVGEFNHLHFVDEADFTALAIGHAAAGRRMAAVCATSDERFGMKSILPEPAEPIHCRSHAVLACLLK